MQTEQTATLTPTGNHTWSITIGGVTDEGFRVVWHGDGRTEFRRTEGGDVEHVVVSGLDDGFQKTETSLEAPVLSLSHPEMWRKTEQVAVEQGADTTSTNSTVEQQPAAEVTVAGPVSPRRRRTGGAGTDDAGGDGSPETAES